MKVSQKNTINFGQIIISRKGCEAIGTLLHRKAVEGESVFVNAFRNSWEKCDKTNFADLVITDNGKVFVQDKLSGNKKRIDAFNSLLNNVFSGIKHVLFAEENRFHF